MAVNIIGFLFIIFFGILCIPVKAQSVDTLKCEIKITRSTEGDYSIELSKDSKLSYRDLVELLGIYFQDKIEPTVADKPKIKTEKI